MGKGKAAEKKGGKFEPFKGGRGSMGKNGTYKVEKGNLDGLGELKMGMEG